MENVEAQTPPSGTFALADLELVRFTYRKILEGYIPWDRLDDLILGETRYTSTYLTRWAYKDFNRKMMIADANFALGTGPEPSCHALHCRTTSPFILRL